MSKGFREQFFVELVPDYDQKKLWGRLQEAAKLMAGVHKEEIGRQVAILKTPMAKNLYLEGKSQFDFSHPFDELTAVRIKEAVYDAYRSDISRRGRRTIYPVEVDPKEVHFSVVEKLVRVPYLGLVKHRHNNKILVTTEAAGWVMENVTSMRISERNQLLCLVIDCREDPSLKKRTKPRSTRRSSKWLE